ncbi:MAG: DNA-processing protein DprA, partial [Gammaproteobacteria bacterium]
ACLALWRCPRVGPATYRRVLEALHRPAAFLDPSGLEALPNCLPADAREPLRHPDSRAALIASAETDWLWSQRAGHAIIFEQQSCYPDALRPFADSPPILFTVGNPDVLMLPQVAVVGTRQPSKGGQINAAHFARGLVEQGMVITSGLALGVDAIAHEHALAAQGHTVAVLGNGLDRVYPKSHTDLARRIIEAGSVLVSEFPLGVAPHRKNFPRRNRIMCGLSFGVLVVEAALKSGSLITARIAADQGKDVFAVPGLISNVMVRGCHQLIREGAVLAESVSDILQILAPRFKHALQSDEASPCVDAVESSIARALSSETTSQEVCAASQKMTQASESDELSCLDTLNPLERSVYEVLDTSPLSMDHLVLRTRLTSQELLVQLMLLELKGLVRTVPGGYLRAA